MTLRPCRFPALSQRLSLVSHLGLLFRRTVRQGSALQRSNGLDQAVARCHTHLPHHSRPPESAGVRPSSGAFYDATRRPTSWARSAAQSLKRVQPDGTRSSSAALGNCDQCDLIITRRSLAVRNYRRGLAGTAGLCLIPQSDPAPVEGWRWVLLRRRLWT
jgi:hypothetical protein